MNKRIWLSLGALVVVVCIIVSVFCVIGAGLLVFRTDQFKVITQPGATATSTIEATLAPQEIGTPEPTLPGGLTKSITDQMDMIQNQVIMLRGLQPNKTLDRALLTTDQLRTKVENDFFKDYSQDDAKKDGAIYSSFGLLPANFDLAERECIHGHRSFVQFR
jgi:hypothetical protein